MTIPVLCILNYELFRFVVNESLPKISRRPPTAKSAWTCILSITKRRFVWWNKSWNFSCFLAPSGRTQRKHEQADRGGRREPLQINYCVFSMRSKIRTCTNKNIDVDTLTRWHADTLTRWHADTLTRWHVDAPDQLLCIFNEKQNKNMRE